MRFLFTVKNCITLGLLIPISNIIFVMYPTLIEKALESIEKN